MNEPRNNAGDSGKIGEQRQGQPSKNPPQKPRPKKDKPSGWTENNIANTDSDITLTSSEVQDFFKGSDN